MKPVFPAGIVLICAGTAGIWPARGAGWLDRGAEPRPFGPEDLNIPNGPGCHGSAPASGAGTGLPVTDGTCTGPGPVVLWICYVGVLVG